MGLYRVIWRFYRDHRDITHVVENQVEKDMENAMGTRGWVWGLGFLGFRWSAGLRHPGNLG